MKNPLSSIAIPDWKKFLVLPRLHFPDFTVFKLLLSVKTDFLLFIFSLLWLGLLLAFSGSEKQYVIFLLEFITGFVPNFLLRKTGRIATVALVFILPGFYQLSGIENILPAAGLFAGAVGGILSRTLLGLFLKVESSKETDPLRKIAGVNRPVLRQMSFLKHPSSGMLVFLAVLALERFVVYYNAPWVKGLGILPMQYLPGMESRQAFFQSAIAISFYLLPLLYLVMEQKSSPDISPIRNHFINGLVIVYFLNFVWFFVMPEVFTLPSGSGFFASRFSISWILPLLLAVFILELGQKKGVWRDFTRYVFAVALFAASAWLLKYLDTLYVFLWTSAVLGMGGYFLFSFRSGWKYRLTISGVLLVLIAALYFYMNHNPQSPHFAELHNKLELLQKHPMADNLKRLSPGYYFQNRAYWDLFADNTVFGRGVGSLKIAIQEVDPNNRRYPGDAADSGSLLLRMLFETGLAGSAVISLWFFIQAYIRSNSVVPFFLILPAIAGNAGGSVEGAFLILLLLFLSQPSRQISWMPLANAFILGVSVLYFIHSLYLVNLEARGPSFRRIYTGTYQLFAEKQQQGNYIFSGKVIWHLAGNAVKIPVTLDPSTRLEQSWMKWSILDAQMQPISHSLSMVSREKISVVSLVSSAEGRYLQAEPCNQEGNPLYFSHISYRIPVFRFTRDNSVF